MEDEGGLNALTVDPRDVPRRPLGLDKMFNRARHWGVSQHKSLPLRPASPPPADISLALPEPLPPGKVTSPLAGLFTYRELVPLVLDELRRPAELAIAAKVCQQWAVIARRRLYADIWVRPWEPAPKQKLLRLFETLSRHPELCKNVRSLDVRFFPLDMRGEMRSELEDMIVASLVHMTKLRRLVWTRDRSLTSELFEAITQLPNLEHLELSGHSTRHFDPLLIGCMPAMRDLRVMMPDASFRVALPNLLKRLDEREIGGLHGLALVCKSYNHLNDDMFRHIAAHLTALRRLQLIGHTRVTKSGVYEILEAAPMLEELILDAPPHSDLVDLSDAPRLPHLRTFSLSFPAPPQRESLIPGDIPRVRRTDSLRALELNITLSGATGGHRQRYLPVPALTALVEQIDFSNLTRLALLNLIIDHDGLTTTLAAAPRLDELYIAILAVQTLNCEALIHSPLRILHANAPDAAGLTRQHLADLAFEMTRLEQIGSQNRVYEVHRRYDGDHRVVELGRWSQITTPGYFQVWRP